MPFALLALTEAPALLAETPTFNDADPGRGLAGGFGVLTHFVLELERPAFKLAETGASIIPAAVPPPMSRAPAAIGSRLLEVTVDDVLPRCALITVLSGRFP